MTRATLGTLFCLLVALPAASSPLDRQGLSPNPRPLPPRVREDFRERFQSRREGPEITERFSRTVRLGRNGAFEITNIAGDITVTGGGGDEVRIEAVKRVRHRDSSEAKAQIDALQIEIVELSNRVEVRTIYPRQGRNISAAVDYTINLPSGATTSIRTVSGDLRVTNVKGELRAETVSGDVVTTGAARLSLVKSVSGDIQVSDASADGEVTVNTVSGNLNARGLKARSIDLGSVSGDVLLTDIQCDRAEVKSVSGNIEYSGSLARNGRYQMKTHSGLVRLAIAGNTGFELEATTFSGSVRSDIPLTLRTGQKADFRDGGRSARMNRSIRGAFGDASAIITLQSFSGDIIVTKR
jgi:DUF4097 and DUF4098 domain-containing protein YvlB